MLQAGILASYATDWLGPRNVRKFGVQFREQVWPGDRLGLLGHGGRRDDDAAHTVDLELVATRVGGGAAIKGYATFAWSSADASSAVRERSRTAVVDAASGRSGVVRP